MSLSRDCTFVGGHVARLCPAAFLALLVFISACKEDVTTIPPEDVPIFGAKRLVLKETGPGGYKLTYSTSTEMEQVVEFYKEQMTLFQWEMAAHTADGQGRQLYYFSKPRRFLNLQFLPFEEGVGCYFIISETGG